MAVFTRNSTSTAGRRCSRVLAVFVVSVASLGLAACSGAGTGQSSGNGASSIEHTGELESANGPAPRFDEGELIFSGCGEIESLVSEYLDGLVLEPELLEYGDGTEDCFWGWEAAHGGPSMQIQIVHGDSYDASEYCAQFEESGTAEVLSSEVFESLGGCATAPDELRVNGSAGNAMIRVYADPEIAAAQSDMLAMAEAVMQRAANP